MNPKLRSGLRTWIEIDRKAIAHNYHLFRSLISPQTKFLAVVKSNAYGNNFLEFAKEMEKLGADYLGVDSIIEGIALRKSGIKKPILVLGYTLPEMIGEAAKNNIEITVSTFETLAFLEKSPVKKLKIHIKVDTGMGRHGFLLGDVNAVLSALKKLKHVEVAGLFTHFSSAKNPAFPEYTKGQLDVFEMWQKKIKDAGYKPIVHASATSGTLLFPEANFDMVRIGIGLYGIWPSAQVRARLEDKYTLQPTLTWKTIIAEIKELPAGSKISYDGTDTLVRKTKIAVCPIGYWHGYPRSLSSIGHVLIAGKRCRVLGRVCMDIIIVDVSQLPKIKVGDEVILLGREGKESMTADDIAELAETSPYEIVTRLNPLIKRIYL